MRYLRRFFQAVAITGTLIVGIVAVALIVSQTPWFKDWLRRYIIRESQQYLNGELSIGRLGGNLFFGVHLSDVVVDVSGQRVVAVKGLEVDYSIFDFISRGIILDELKLNQPTIVLVRDADGWNLGRLIKKQRKEADREGPGRPVSLSSIEVADATVSVRDVVGTAGVAVPQEIADLDIKASFQYEPVRYTVELEHLSFVGASPQIALTQATGKIAVRDDTVFLDQVTIATPESSVRVDGAIEQYLKTPLVKVTTSGRVSLPEIGRIVPALAAYRLHPQFEVKANGPAERMALDLDVRSEAGHVRGQVTADVKGPAFGADGTVQVERLDLAPILRDAGQRSDITGRAQIDLDVAASPADAPVLERLRGRFRFTGPRVLAAGYDARDVRVTGRLAGRRIEFDGRAMAYGASTTAKGFIVTPGGRSPVSFDLTGSANGVNLRNLPASIGAPNVTTNLSIAQYRVRRQAEVIEGTATLNRSTIEGATVGDGTVTDFVVAPGTITYASRGSVEGLDLERVGRAFDIAAIAKPEYASRLSGTFDVKGSVPRRPPGRRESGSTLAEMTLDASGRLKGSEIMGGTLPDLGYEAHVAGGTLTARADGRFEHFDPARLLSQPRVKGDVTGTVNAAFTIANLGAPVTPESVTASGQLALEPSTVGGLRMDTASVDGSYANQVGDIKQFTLAGPDVKAEASGRVALDASSASNLKYHVEAVNIPELAKLVGQDGVGGSAILDGTLTGNRSSLTTTGTLDGSNISYKNNNALDLDSQYTVTVPNLSFASARVEASTTGTFIKAGAFEISELTAKTTYENQRLGFTTNVKEKTRELDATGEVIFHPDHQELHLPSLAMRTQGVEWRTAPGSEATIKYAQQRVEFENLRLVSGDQSLDVTGTIATGGETPSGTLDVKANNVDLPQLETLMLQDRGFGGKLSANVRLTGTVQDPTVDGHLEIHNGSFRTYQYESLVADVDYTGRRATIDATLTQTATEKITAKGSVPVSLFTKGTSGHAPETASEAVDLHVTSTAMNLGLVQGFTDFVTNVTGTFQADVRVSGSGADPHFKGFIDIRGGGFGVPRGGVTYTGLDTRIELTDDLARLQEFQLRDEHGQPLRVSGQIAVHENQVGAVDIAITSDNFELVDNELGDVGVDANLKITGELRRPRVVGEVRLEAARVEVDRVLQLFYDPYATEAHAAVVSAERVVEGSGSAAEATKAALDKAQVAAAPPGADAPADAPPAPTGVFDAVSLDVRLVIPDNLVLRGKDLRPGGPTGAALGDINITVGGDVQVRKAASVPIVLIGEVTPVRGTYDFQGRRFELQRGGFVRFVGEPQINPPIDITATRLIPNTGVEARVRVTGTARKPELQLTSNPPLEESDILALIVFNRPVNELGTGERSSLAATAGGIATGFLAAPLGESIGRALDLDLFEITTSTEEGDLGAGVTLGQQLGDRAFLKLRQQFGERTITEFLVEYRLARFLRLEATAAPDTSGSANRLNQRRIERGGIDLIFFFSY